MIAIRSHWRSASSIWCVVTSSVVPTSSRSAPSRSQTSRRAVGSRPTVGSSRKSTSGRFSSAVAISSRRSMPPDSVRPSRSRNEPRFIASTACVDALAPLAARHAGHAAVELEVLVAPSARRRSRSPAARSRSPARTASAVADDVVRRRRTRVPRSGAAASSARGSWSSCRRRSGRAGRRPRRRRRRTRRRATASTSPKRTTRPSTDDALGRSSTRASAVTGRQLLAARAQGERRLRGQPHELDAFVRVERGEHVGRRTAAAATARSATSSSPACGEPDDGRAPVALEAVPLGEPELLEPVDEPRRGRLVDADAVGELADPQPVVLGQHVERAAACSASASCRAPGAGRPAAGGSRGSPRARASRSRARRRAVPVHGDVIPASYNNCLMHGSLQRL